MPRSLMVGHRMGSVRILLRKANKMMSRVLGNRALRLGATQQGALARQQAQCAWYSVQDRLPTEHVQREHFAEHIAAGHAAPKKKNKKGEKTNKDDKRTREEAISHGSKNQEEETTPPAYS